MALSPTPRSPLGWGTGTYSAVRVLCPLAVGSTGPGQGEAAVTPETEGRAGGKRQVGCSRPQSPCNSRDSSGDSAKMAGAAPVAPRKQWAQPLESPGSPPGVWGALHPLLPSTPSSAPQPTLRSSGSHPGTCHWSLRGRVGWRGQTGALAQAGCQPWGPSSHGPALGPLAGGAGPFPPALTPGKDPWSSCPQGTLPSPHA